MITKRDLESIPSIIKRIENYDKQISIISADIPDGSKGIDYTRDRVQVSNQDIQERLVVSWIHRIEVFQKRMWGYRKLLMAKLDAAYSFIESIDDEMDKAIVQQHCIFGETFDEIARDLNSSQSTVHRRYTRCLRNHGVI